MKESGMLLFPIFFPIIMGILLLLLKNSIKRSAMITLTAIGLFGTAIAVIGVIGSGETAFTLFQLTMRLPVYFKVDAVGRLFVSVVTIVWVLAGIYAFRYMQHEDCNKRYFGFYLIVYGVLVGLDFSGNLITFYLFYECMTLLSLPLVFHTRTREAVMAGLKYLFYSLAGAYLALFGLYFINRYGNTLTFTAGGVLDFSLVEGHEGLLLVVAFLMLMGFGVKAGLFPMQGWLPAAHPVAPAPASAVLSGIIVKSGVLGIIRVVYFIFGAEFLKGSWVQKVFLGLALGTVFLGSMLAYLEKGLKKRLAYSTVSQVSYILFGLLLLNPAGMTGAFLHVIFHAVIKSGLFLCAGAIIFRTGKTRVDELRGIGKEMPVTIGCMTLLSLALIGSPSCKRLCQQMVSGCRFAVLGNRLLQLAGAGGTAAVRAAHGGLSASHNHEGVFPRGRRITKRLCPEGSGFRNAGSHPSAGCPGCCAGYVPGRPDFPYQQHCTAAVPDVGRRKKTDGKSVPGKKKGVHL